MSGNNSQVGVCYDEHNMVERDVGQSIWQSAEIDVLSSWLFQTLPCMLFQCVTPLPMTHDSASMTWQPSQCGPWVGSLGLVFLLELGLIWTVFCQFAFSQSALLAFWLPSTLAPSLSKWPFGVTVQPPPPHFFPVFGQLDSQIIFSLCSAEIFLS